MIIQFPKPTRLPIDLVRKEGWLLSFPTGTDYAKHRQTGGKR